MSVVKYFGVVGAIAVLSLLTFLTPAADACMCMPKHPQAHFCDSDYVIIMRVLRKSHRLIENRIAYKIEVKKSYKMTNGAQDILKHGRILTPVHDSTCGATFELGKLYVVAGKGNTLYRCNYIKEYQNMTIIERRGFAGSYRKGCDCKIKHCTGYCTNMNNQSCRWSQFSTCETDFGSCVPTIYRTPEGLHRKCEWKRTPPYKACLSNP